MGRHRSRRPRLVALSVVTLNISSPSLREALHIDSLEVPWGVIFDVDFTLLTSRTATTTEKMPTLTLMAHSPTQQVRPWAQSPTWSLEPQQSLDHISSTNTTIDQQTVYFEPEPHIAENQEVELLNKTNVSPLRMRDPLMVPIKKSPIQITQPVPDSAIMLRRQPYQTEEESSRTAFPDEIKDLSNESESILRKEQKRTMSSPAPKYGLSTTAHLTPIGTTPPRSTTSPAVLDSRILYEDFRTSLPPSPIQSHRPQPNYVLRNPSVMASHYDAKNLTPRTIVTSNLNASDYICQTPHTPFNTEWSQIQKRRTDIMGLRSQIREIRRRLREKQNAKSLAEDRFFQKLRKKEMRGQERVVNQEDELMMHLMQEYQDARDNYGPLEDDCNQLEDKLYADEFFLHELENDFYHKWAVVPDTTPQPSSSPLLEVLQTPNSENFDEDANFSYHPAVEKYLSKQGDLDLLFERLDEIHDERENLVEQSETRAALGLSLGEEELAWLERSEDLLIELDLQIDAMEADVESLKQECLAQNLIDEDGEPIDMRTKEMQAFSDEDDLETKSEISQYTKYPKIIQQPLVKDDEGEDYLPDLGDKSYSIGAMINRWMLDRLRSSALEVNLLARTYENERDGEGPKNEGSDWQISVLKLWYADGTIGFEAHTSTVRSGISGRSDTPMHPSEITKTLRNSLVQIRVASSLPTEREDRKQLEGGTQVGGLAPPWEISRGASSRSQ